MRKTLYGYDKPRLVFLNNTTQLDMAKVTIIGDGFLKFRDTIPSNVTKDMAIYGENYDGDETWARITRISDDTVYHTTFSFGPPAMNTYTYAKYTVYDLPFTQGPLRETYTPDFITHRLYNGTRTTNIRGWWYSVILDYGKKLNPEQLEYFNNIFSSTRDYDIRFYPRRDNYLVYYTVEPDPSTNIEIANRPFWNGHRFFKVKLNGTTRLSSVALSPTQFGLITEGGDIITDEDGEVITP